VSARDNFDLDPLELRVLSGCHAGAHVEVADGMTVGRDESADIVLSDLDPALGTALLSLASDGRWSLGGDAQGVPARAGAVRRIGGLSLSVSAARAAWPVVAADEDEVASVVPVAPMAPTSETRPVAVAASAAPALAPVAVNPPRAEGRFQKLARSPLGIAAAVLAVALVGLAVSLGSASRPAPAASLPASAEPRTAAAQQQLIKDVNLAVARVDPALRLQVTPMPDGRVSVAGWVGSSAEWDRIADALGGLRPMPVMRVREIGDLRDELRSRLGPQMRPLEFEGAGSGALRVKGLALSPADRERLLADLRAMMPAGVELLDGLELADRQAPAFAGMLRAAGFSDANAMWDGDQMVASLRLSTADRGRLEQVLGQFGKRFPGLMFTVDAQPAPIAGAPPVWAQAVRGAPGDAVPMSRAGLPFQVRSVAGGATPVVQLDDGTRLLVGGSIGNWRLAAVEPDYLVFDGPRRVAVLR
jgi:type III secretion protein D